MSEIIDLNAAQLSVHIHEKKISCQEVMSAFLNRIKAVNPAVSAVVALRDEDDLLQAARACDAALADGRDAGWMHGFPLAVKDLEDTVDAVTTYGSPIFAGYRPKADSLMVSRLKSAGAIIIGKTNTPEWGFGSQTYNPVYGATGNPYDPTRTAGGSSGGAACALALRMQPVCDGSDYMGSLRNPAGWCNVFGFRPSWGRAPSAGLELFVSNCGTVGPMARTVPDLALLLAAQSGYEAGVPASLPDDPDLKQLTPQHVKDRLQTNPRGRRIGWLADWGGYLAMEEGILAQCEAGLKRLEEIGVVTEPVRPPSDPGAFWQEVWLPFRHMNAASLKVHYEDPAKRKLLKPEAIFEYEGSLRYTAQDIYEAGLARSRWYRTMLQLFDSYDYLAVPTAQVYAFDKSIPWPQEIAGRKMDTYHRWMEVVTHWTMSGNPVAAVPLGPDGQGRMMGLQIIGRPRSDFDLLQFIRAYEQHVDPAGRNRPAH